MVARIFVVVGQTAALVALYYGALLAAVVLRFGQLPDFVHLHPWLSNVRLLIEHTPRLELGLRLALREPLLEVGRMLPDLPAAEWGVSLVPLKAAAVIAAAVAVVLLRRRAQACPARRTASALTGGGAALTAFASATVGWIACCTFPNWTVLVAMAGLWIPSAMALEPWGAALTAVGLALLAAGHIVNRRASA